MQSQGPMSPQKRISYFRCANPDESLTSSTALWHSAIFQNDKQLTYYCPALIRPGVTQVKHMHMHRSATVPGSVEPLLEGEILPVFARFRLPSSMEKIACGGAAEPVDPGLDVPPVQGRANTGPRTRWMSISQGNDSGASKSVGTSAHKRAAIRIWRHPNSLHLWKPAGHCTVGSPCCPLDFP